MTERSVTHATFVIERRYAARPARVFAACSDPAQKAAWFIGPEEWASSDYSLEFRVGGREHARGGVDGGPALSYDAVIQDIVEDQRIVTTYEMGLDGRRISVSVGTLELAPDGDGTLLVYTEQGAFLDGLDNAAQREGGSRVLFDKLAAALDGEPAIA